MTWSRELLSSILLGERPRAYSGKKRKLGTIPDLNISNLTMISPYTSGNCASCDVSFSSLLKKRVSYKQIIASIFRYCSLFIIHDFTAKWHVASVFSFVSTWTRTIQLQFLYKSKEYLTLFSWFVSSVIMLVALIITFSGVCCPFAAILSALWWQFLFSLLLQACQESCIWSNRYGVYR